MGHTTRPLVLRAFVILITFAMVSFMPQGLWPPGLGPLGSALGAQPDDEDTSTAGSGLSVHAQDWTVESGSDSWYGNQTIRLSGNLTVTSGYNLTLFNVLLEFDNAGLGYLGIMVEEGGRLTLTDTEINVTDTTTPYDPDPWSPGDERNGTFYNFTVFGTLYADNSQIYHTWSNYTLMAPPIFYGGLSLYSGDVVIDGCNISYGNLLSIGIYGGSGHIINNTVLYDNVACGAYVYNATPTISNCTVWRNRASGMTFGNGSAPYVYKNTVYNNSNGLTAIKGSLAVIHNNTVYENEDTGVLASKCALNLTGNDIFDNNRSGVFLFGVHNTTLRWNRIFNNTDVGCEVTRTTVPPLLVENDIHGNPGDGVRCFETGQDVGYTVTLKGNDIHHNGLAGGAGVSLEFGNATLSGNDIHDNFADGVAAQAVLSLAMDGDQLSGNGDAGMLMAAMAGYVFDCDFTGNTGPGVEAMNGATPALVNCTFAGNDMGIHSHSDNSQSHPTAANSTFSSHVTDDVLAEGGSQATVINCSVTASELTCVDSLPTAIYGKWYLHLKAVRSGTQTPLTDIDVRVNISMGAGGGQEYDGTIGGSGSIMYIPVTEFMKVQSGPVTRNPHIIEARKAGYLPYRSSMSFTSSGWRTLELDVNHDPGDPTNLGPVQTHNLTPTITWDSSVDTDGDTLNYTLSIWAGSDDTGSPYVLGLKTAASSYAISPMQPFSMASAYFVRVTAIDPWGGTSGPLEGMVLTTNTGPGAPGLKWEVSPVRSHDDLVLAIESPSADPDTDPPDEILYTYRWEHDDAPRPELTVENTTSLLSIVDSSETAKGDNWTCSVTAFDGYLYSAPSKLGITVENTPPRVANPPDNTTSSEENLVLLPVNLDKVFIDRDGDELTFWVAGNGSVEVDIDDGATDVQVRMTPAGDFFGFVQMTFWASDGEESVSVLFNLTIQPVNDPPFFTLINGLDATEAGNRHFTVEEHQHLGVRLAADDPDGDMLNFSLPASGRESMAIDPVTGIFSFDPVGDDVGDLIVTIRVEDMDRGFSEIALSISVVNINDAPYITGLNVSAPSEGGEYTPLDLITLEVSADDPDMHVPGSVEELSYNWTNGSGEILWTGERISVQLPPGEHVLRVTVSDLGGLQATSTANIAVVAGPEDGGDDGGDGVDDNVWEVTFGPFIDDEGASLDNVPVVLDIGGASIPGTIRNGEVTFSIHVTQIQGQSEYTLTHSDRTYTGSATDLKDEAVLDPATALTGEKEDGGGGGDGSDDLILILLAIVAVVIIVVILLVLNVSKRRRQLADEAAALEDEEEAGDGEEVDGAEGEEEGEAPEGGAGAAAAADGEGSGDDEAEGFMCPDCGADVEGDSDGCPSCGAVFDIPEDEFDETGEIDRGEGYSGPAPEEYYPDGEEAEGIISPEEEAAWKATNGAGAPEEGPAPEGASPPVSETTPEKTDGDESGPPEPSPAPAPPPPGPPAPGPKAPAPDGE